MTATATAEVAAPAMSIRAILGFDGMRRLWVAQGISDVGDAFTSLGLLLVVNQLTGSTAALALMAIVLAVPQVVFGVIAGAWVDRLDRRRLMIASDLVRAVLVLGFVVAASGDRLWLLYLLAFAQASVGTFFTPARTALDAASRAAHRAAGRELADAGHPDGGRGHRCGRCGRAGLGGRRDLACLRARLGQLPVLGAAGQRHRRRRGPGDADAPTPTPQPERPERPAQAHRRRDGRRSWRPRWKASASWPPRGP